MSALGGIVIAWALVVIGYRIAGHILRKAPPYWPDTPDGDVWPATILSNHQEGE